MLKIEGLSKTYADGTEALRNVSLEVQPGEFVMVLGKSGSGKSTLLRCINRLVEPTRGTIAVDGFPITGQGPRKLRKTRRKIGIIFQDYNLVKRLSVLTNTLTGRLGYLSSWRSMFNYFPRESLERALHNLERLEIGDKLNARAGSLSGGQQQRVGIARALMQNPKIILADEPVSSLDPATARTILDILREINRQDGVTIICNIHLPDLALEYGERILALKEGAIVLDRPVTELNAAGLRPLYESN